MKKATILDLYIKDLESHVPKSEARDNRLKVLKEELDKELTASAVSNRRELLIAYEVKKHPFLADKYKLEYATKLVDKYLKSN